MRYALQDPLQTNSFFIMDVALMSTAATPILTPLFGFSAITAPELTIDVQEIAEGNWFFKRKILKRTADIGNITLQRGVTFYDTDFYSWIINALAGEQLISATSSLASPGGIAKAFGRTSVFNPRRNLLLLHFFSRNVLSGPVDAILNLGASALGLGAGAATGAGQAIFGTLDTTNNVNKLIPARAFMLKGCLPIRYKTGTDFDATSAQVSIQELEIAVEQMEQVVLGV